MSTPKEKLPEGWFYAPPLEKRGLTREQFDAALASGNKTVYNDSFHCWKGGRSWFQYECQSGCCDGEFESLDEAWEFMAGDSPERLYVIPPEFPGVRTAETSNKCVSGDCGDAISGQKEPN